MVCNCFERIEETMMQNPDRFGVKTGECLESTEFLGKVMIPAESTYTTVILTIEGRIKKPDGTVRKAKFVNFVAKHCPICGTLFDEADKSATK